MEGFKYKKRVKEIIEEKKKLKSMVTLEENFDSSKIKEINFNKNIPEFFSKNANEYELVDNSQLDKGLFNNNQINISESSSLMDINDDDNKNAYSRKSKNKSIFFTSIDPDKNHFKKVNKFTLNKITSKNNILATKQLSNLKYKNQKIHNSNLSFNQNKNNKLNKIDSLKLIAKKQTNNSFLDNLSLFDITKSSKQKIHGLFKLTPLNQNLEKIFLINKYLKSKNFNLKNELKNDDRKKDYLSKEFITNFNNYYSTSFNLQSELLSKLWSLKTKKE